MLELVQVLSERAAASQHLKDTNERLDDSLKKMKKAYIVLRHNKEAEEKEKEDALARVRNEIERAEEAERREKVLVARVAELERVVTKHVDQVAQLEKQVGELKQAEEARLQEVVVVSKSWWQGFLSVFVRKLSQTRGFGKIFAKLADPTVRFGRHQAAVAVREVYSTIPKEHVRGWDEQAEARLNYKYASLVQRMDESFPLVEHLAGMSEVPSIEYLESCDVDRHDQVMAPIVEPEADPEAVSFNLGLREVFARRELSMPPLPSEAELGRIIGMEELGEGLLGALDGLPEDEVKEAERAEEDDVQV